MTGKEIKDSFLIEEDDKIRSLRPDLVFDVFQLSSLVSKSMIDIILAKDENGYILLRLRLPGATQKCKIF